MTFHESDAVCRAALDKSKRSWHSLRVPPRARPGYSFRSELDGEGPLFPGGVVVLSCGSKSVGPATAIVGYSVLKGVILWRRSVAGVETYGATPRHIVAFTSTTTPASGLQGGSTSYIITAYDVQTGRQVWSVPFAADSAAEEGMFNYRGLSGIVEGPSGVPGHPEEVVIQDMGTSAYNAASGELLWHVPDIFGGYVGNGIVEKRGYEDNDEEGHVTGFNVQTGAMVWDLHLPRRCWTDQSELVGTVQWGFGNSCVEAYDFVSGKLVSDAAYPEGWKGVAANHSYIVVFDGSSLSEFSTSDISNPLWSEPAGSTEPLIVTDGHVLVEAPSGMLVLSTQDGSVVAHVGGKFPTLNAAGLETLTTGPIEGLVATSEENGDVAVLDLDH